MITIDCPMCDGLASTDEAISAMTCDGCGVTVDVAADQRLVLEVAA